MIESDLTEDKIFTLRRKQSCVAVYGGFAFEFRLNSDYEKIKADRASSQQVSCIAILTAMSN